jgi:AcrR family transcriptional regulator
LLALIEQQDLNAVSIADVTRRAGVSRSTFYDHYADLHELAESACTEMFEALLAETPVFALSTVLAQAIRWWPCSSTSWNTAGCTPPFWGLTAARASWAI